MENNNKEQKQMYTAQAYNTLFQKLKRVKEREKKVKSLVRELWNLLVRTK